MGENELSFDNILGEQEIETLFDDAPEVDNSGGEEKKEETPDKDKEEKETKTAEVTNPDDLFDEPDEKKPESVGSEKKKILRKRKILLLTKTVVLLQMKTSTLPLPVPVQWMVSSQTLMMIQLKRQMMLKASVI